MQLSHLVQVTFCRGRYASGMLLVFVLAASLMHAQVRIPTATTPATLNADVTEQNHPVTYSDLYCAGFLASAPLSTEGFVAAGAESPTQARYTTGEFIFLRGNGYEPGSRVSIVRALRDPYYFSPFQDASKLQKQAGQLYGDIGYAVVLEKRGTNIAVARIEFACDTVVPGDQIIPFQLRAPVSYRKSSTMDVFPAAPSPISGRIVAARDFDQYQAAGRKVYLNVGSDRGLKPGDYLRVVRGFSREEMDQVDVGTLNADVMEDTQKNPPRLPKTELKDLPRQVVGEVLILNAQPKTATAMITFSLQDVHIGDTVELEEGR